MKKFRSLNEDLRKWFDKDHPEGGWKRINSKGEAIGPCAREPGESKPKCMSNEKRASLSKKERASAVKAKRKHDPNPERKGGPINVSNFGKGKLSEDMEQLDEKNAPTNPGLWARAKSMARSKFDVYPSAYANGWASKWYKSKGGGWKTVSEEIELEEGRPSQRHPLEGHEYHKKSNDALVHIAKDAHKAAEAMKSHNTDAENKYRDQANDSATVRHFRQKSGMPDWYKKKYGHMNEETDTSEKVEMVQSQLHFMKYACEEILEYIEMGGEVEEWYQVKVAKSFSEFESLHAYIEGESRRTGMKEETQHKVGDSVIANSKFFGKQKGVVTKIDKQSVHVKREGKKFSEKYPHDSVMKEETEQLNENAMHGTVYLHKYHEGPSEDSYGEVGKDHTQHAHNVYHKLPGKKPKLIGDTEHNVHNKTKKTAHAVARNDEMEYDHKSHSDAVRHVMDAAGVHPATPIRFVKDKKQMNEEVEQIDELSNELLGRYKDKAAADASAADKRIKEETQLDNLTPASKTFKEKPNKEPMTKMKQEQTSTSVPFEGSKPKTGTVTDKSGAKHGSMSRVRDLARQALKRQSTKMKPVKESLDESRKAEIIKEIVKKKKNEKTTSDDKFQKEPVLSSEITKT